MARLWQVGWLRWLVVRLVVAGSIYAVAYTVLNYRLTAAIAREAAAMRQDGFPVSAADLQRKKVPVSQDAGPLWRAAAELHSVLKAEIDAAADLDAELSINFVRLSDGKFESIRGDSEREPTERDIERLRDLVRRHERILSVLREAADKPGFNSQVDYSNGTATFLPDLQPAMQMACFCRMAAELAADQGDYLAAVEHLTAMSGLCRWMRDEPVLICLVVRVAIEDFLYDSIREIVAKYDLPDSQLSRLQLLVAEDPEDRQRSVKAVSGEMILFTETMNLLLNGRSPDPASAGSGMARLSGPPRLWILVNQREGLRFWHTYLKELGQSQWPLVPIRSRHHPGLEIPRYAAAARALAPSLDAVYKKVNEHEARRRVTALGLALMLQKRARGAYPESLDALLPEFSRGAGPAIDPMIGPDAPLIYQRQGEGFVVYSRGQNGTDDGGQWERDSKGKLAADDVAFQVDK
ncbi:MAG: hypothetical protein JXL80_07150 [Planctomycetes bacterium]|nr:hypothetical protein [Planctomycetota bacterium]